MENINLTAFEKAIKSLDEVIKVYSEDKENLIVRDSLIQRFEYTYSIALKMIKRYFKNSAFVLDNIEDMTFNETIRQANKMGLLCSDLEKWTIYRQKRNMTSHTYDNKIADDVVSIVEDFYKEVEFLYARLKEKND